jgi:hypothetical protein
MEKIMWLVLGAIAFVAALQAGHSRRALYVGRWALGLLFIAFWAAVNAIYLAAGDRLLRGLCQPVPVPVRQGRGSRSCYPTRGSSSPC